MPSPSIQQLAETLHSLHRTTRVRRGDDKDFDDDDDDEDSGLHNHGSSNDVFGNGYSSGSNNNGGDDHLGSSPWVDRGGLGNGAVAGISVAAAVIFLAVISALLFFFLRRRRQLHRLQNQPYLYRKSSHDSDLELRSGSSSLRSRDNVVYAKYAAATPSAAPSMPAFPAPTHNRSIPAITPVSTGTTVAMAPSHPSTTSSPMTSSPVAPSPVSPVSHAGPATPPAVRDDPPSYEEAAPLRSSMMAMGAVSNGFQRYRSMSHREPESKSTVPNS